MVTAGRGTHDRWVLLVDWLLVLPVFALLVALLRWTFGDDRSVGLGGGEGSGYGLLREVAVAPTRDAADALRSRLRREGVRATTAPTEDGTGCRVLVFPTDEATARLVLHQER
jgi:hypothetical protein